MKNSVVFGLSLLAGILWLIGAWPGYTQFDSFNFIKISREGNYQGWLSIGFSRLTNLADLFPNPVAMMSMFLLSSFSLLMYFWWNTLKKNNVQIRGWYLIILILNPLILGMNIFYNREVPFAIIGSFLVICFYQWKYSEGPGKFDFILWSCFLGVFTELRQDAKIFLILMPAAAFYLKIFNWKKIIASISVAALVHFMISYPFHMEKRYDHVKKLYALTGTFSTLIAFQWRQPAEKLTYDDYSVIRKIINLDIKKFNENTQPYSYLLPNTNIGDSVSREDYYKKIVELFFRDFFGILYRRIFSFMDNLAISSGHSEWYSDGLNESSPDMKIAGDLDIHSESIVTEIFKIQKWIYHNMIQNFPVRVLFFSNLWALIFFSVASFLYSRAPVTSVIAKIMMLKYVIIYLVAPLPNANYLYWNYLVLLFVIPFFLFEYRRTRSNL